MKAGTAGVPTVVPAWYDGWTLGCHIPGYFCSSTKLFNQPVYVRGSVTDFFVITSPPLDRWNDFHSFILLALDHFQLIYSVTDNNNNQQQASKLAIQR